jgi:hypothetical protein
MQAMKKIFALALSLCLAFAVSCRKQEPAKPSVDGGPGAPGSTAAPAKIENELFYKYTVDRLNLENEVNAQYLNILKAADKADSQLENKILEYEKQTAQKYKDLRTKYEASFAELERMSNDPDAKKDLGNFLAQDPGRKKQVEDLEQLRQKLDDEINAEMERLHPSPPPPPEAALPGATAQPGTSVQHAATAASGSKLKP